MEQTRSPELIVSADAVVVGIDSQQCDHGGESDQPSAHSVAHPHSCVSSSYSQVIFNQGHHAR